MNENTLLGYITSFVFTAIGCLSIVFMVITIVYMTISMIKVLLTK